MSKPRALWLIATLIVLLTTLYFGLDPKEYDFSNNVSWLPGQPGMHFDKYGIVYARLHEDVRKVISSGKDGFSILIGLRPQSQSRRAFQHILTISSGNDRNQLVVGQWLSHIIVMNGDDYAHRRKTPRISARIRADLANPIFLSITTGKNGTRLCLDGKVVESDPGLILQFPHEEGSKLLIGDSVYGKNSWQGDIFGLAIYGRELSPASIASRYNVRAEKPVLGEFNGETPVLLYRFDERGGNQVLDHAGGSTPLILPRDATPLKKAILKKPLSASRLNGGLIKDAIINLVGFIPLGFFLAAAFSEFEGFFPKRAMLLSVMFCFAVSLAIEFLQAWMPSRSSQSLDLILNTIGGAIGAWCLKANSKRILVRE